MVVNPKRIVARMVINGGFTQNSEHARPGRTMLTLIPRIEGIDNGWAYFQRRWHRPYQESRLIFTMCSIQPFAEDAQKTRSPARTEARPKG